MPLAVPLTLAAKTFTVREKILAIEQIADTMTHLHARGISHRDIKPENILLFMNRSHICDFGCVTYPKKPPLTRDLRWVGPVWTMAPEVRRNDTKADPMPADVYSLAKTLWITLTGTVKGFDGQYSGDGTLSIRSTCEDLYVTPIEELLVTSTDHLPSKRPTMYEFTKALRGWLSLSAEYQQCNTLRWKDALHKLFPFAVPARATWHRIDAIVRVLNNIGSIRGLSTLIFPDGGRTDFGRIVRSECDGDYIELCADDAIVVKPSRLIFESLSDDPRWSYFRLECIEADPRKDRPVLEELRLEEGMDIGGTKPMELSASEETPYTGELLRESGCRAHRRLGGVLIICQNTSQFDIRS
jgi:serine/threonine-protein kinase